MTPTNSLTPLSKTDSTPPRRVMFLLTSMPVGGAETLLVNLVRKLDRNRFTPLIGCMKEKGVLGEMLATEIKVFDQLLNHKYDFAVAGRLKKIFLDEKIDVLITVGAGDKMFWGRLGARRARVPVILSALHSTGWPDGVGRLNRMLTRITDGFIAVARQHAEYQVQEEKFPASKVFLIPNGIDTDRFVMNPGSRSKWRSDWDIDSEAPVVGVVAALRPEKNLELFLESARIVSQSLPDSRFVIAGDGEERERLMSLATIKGIDKHVRFLGSTHDIPGVLSMIDVFALTSHNEASPVSIMEALACERPVVATDVGSIDESVIEGETGFLVPAGDANRMAARWLKALRDSNLRHRLGSAGRAHIIKHSSLESMTDGYMDLMDRLLAKKIRPMAQGTPFDCPVVADNVRDEFLKP